MQPFWEYGYAFEAAKYTLNYGFNQLHLKTITGMAHVENSASLKILEKLGMQFIKEDMVDSCPVKTFRINSPADHANPAD
jgi:RimJ/RimL family protein N-acetyltransferase